jgi:hypothetical protein
LIAAHYDQGDIVLVVRAKPLGRVHLGCRSTAADEVLEHEAIAADISKPPAAREHSDAVAALTQPGRIERTDDARAVDQNIHGHVLTGPYARFRSRQGPKEPIDPPIKRRTPAQIRRPLF